MPRQRTTPYILLEIGRNRTRLMEKDVHIREQHPAHEPGTLKRGEPLLAFADPAANNKLPRVVPRAFFRVKMDARVVVAMCRDDQQAARLQHTQELIAPCEVHRLRQMREDGSTQNHIKRPGIERQRRFQRVLGEVDAGQMVAAPGNGARVDIRAIQPDRAFEEVLEVPDHAPGPAAPFEDAERRTGGNWSISPAKYCACARPEERYFSHAT